MAPKVKCHVCSKPYSVGYLKKHIKKDHSDQGKDIELGDQGEVNVNKVNMWVENEKEMSFATRDLDSFLNNQSDLDIMNAAAQAENINEAVEQIELQEQEMNQCLEWYDEDHNEAFNFTSDFAEELRRESIQLIRPQYNQNKLVADMKKKEDELVKRTTKLLNQAEIQKLHLRKTVRSLQRELADTMKSWERSEKTNREELSKVNAELAAAIKETKKPEVTEVDQKCDHCKFTCKESKNMNSHIASVHGKQNCHICSEVFTSKAALRNHVRKHLTNQLKYTCGVCQKDYKNIEDAKDHAMNVCGSIQEKGATQESVLSENIHECKLCNVKFNSNSTLEKHTKEKHECVDCTKCNVIFKSQEDYYKHANNCSEICDPNMCEYCNMELVSKAGLIKHMEKCKKKQKVGRAKDKCTNGPKCKYHKENRCSFEHDTEGEQPWKVVKHRVNGKPQNIHHKQQHSSNQQNQNKQHIPKHQQKTGRYDQAKDECRNGPSCIFLKHNKCRFSHKETRQDRSSTSQQTRGGAPKQGGPTNLLRPCKFGNKCNQGVNCTFLHLPTDFLPQQGGRRN